jgi:hypothetical protein
MVWLVKGELIHEKWFITLQLKKCGIYNHLGDKLIRYKNILVKLYLLSLKRGEPQIVWIERYLDLNVAEAIALDDERNELNMYTALFSKPTCLQIEKLYM